jgi:hypothetical protein
VAIKAVPGGQRYEPVLPRDDDQALCLRLGERNGYSSKTDSDTAFMRMKKDHGETKFCRGNGQPKQAHNVQTVGYNLIPNPETR